MYKPVTPTCIIWFTNPYPKPVWNINLVDELGHHIPAVSGLTGHITGLMAKVAQAFG